VSTHFYVKTQRFNIPVFDDRGKLEVTKLSSEGREFAVFGHLVLDAEVSKHFKLFPLVLLQQLLHLDQLYGIMLSEKGN
jgi:hypothetical protein